MKNGGFAILDKNGRPAILQAIENNWYEGSRWSPNRSWIWFPLQDAKHDLDRFTRYELNKHARYLYKNSTLIRGLIARLVTLTVGSGFHPVFKSIKNPDWALKAQAWWEKRKKNIHLTHRCSFSQYQRAIARARFVDGEAFSIKTFSNRTYQDCVQGVESDRCSSMADASATNDNAASKVDGIDLDGDGAVAAYYFRGASHTYTADEVVHHYTPGRVGQYRGETILAAAINTARDVDDILALEKQSVKNASSRKDVIETNSGEIDPEMARLLRYGPNQPGGQFPTIFSLPEDDRTKSDYYRIGFGADSVVLKAGDKYSLVKPDRPGSAWTGFMEFLSNTICLSTEMPPSVILPIDVGGTDIRRDLDIAQRVVGPWQYDIACELEEIVMYLAEGEIYDGALTGAPDDWTLTWHFPQKINVDRSKVLDDLKLVQAGLMSWEEFHGRYSVDGDAYELAVINEAKRRKKRIEDAGFENMLEFVQVLSMDGKLFTSRITEQIDPADESLVNPSTKPPKKKLQLQNQ